MGIYSLSNTSKGLYPVEVEVHLVRGLPGLQVLGRPDAAIKECALRLKTAFQNTGWEWPRTQQVIVNLKPAHLRKDSSGLDLAIALALRVAQGELNLTESFSAADILAFGEVDLNGGIQAPEDLLYWEGGEGNKPLLTGKNELELHYETFEIRNLAELNFAEKKPAKTVSDFLKKPKLKKLRFSAAAAKLLEVAAVGEHSVLLAGAAGGGKTTWAETLWSLLPPPYEHEFLKTRLYHKKHKRDLAWRPFLQPHHTASNISLVGGGAPPRPGAFTLAHGGVLLMDEYLEFSKEIQEALREPMEKAEIHLFRGTEMKIYPSRFQLIATTNLCPCGSFEPERPVRCSYSLRRCRSVLEKLSGPVLDRFDIVAFTSGWGVKEVDIENLQERIERAFEFRKSRGQKRPNSLLSLQHLLDELPEGLHPYLPNQSVSQRRLRALLRAARSLADLDGAMHIRIKDIREAMELAWIPFEKIRQC